MDTRSQVEKRQMSYLLGLCSPAERERIESEYFENDDAFQEMLSAEVDLIDAYARGELTAEERQRFERHFLTSLRARDRVQFARTLTTAQTSLLEVNSFSGWRSRLRIAAIAAVIVLAVVVSWVLIERRRMLIEPGESRTQNAGLGKETERLPDVRNGERTSPEPQAEIENRQPAAERRPKHTEQRRQVAEHEPRQVTEPVVNRSDATLGNSFENKRITELPLETRNVANLLTLQPGVTRDGYVSGARADQSNITLDGIDIDTAFSLQPRSYYATNITTITLAKPVESITLQLPLTTAAQYVEYYATLETGDSRPVTWLSWAEPNTEKRNSSATPAISTADLPAGDYVLRLTAKKTDGSVVQVAEYWFRVVQN